MTLTFGNESEARKTRNPPIIGKIAIMNGSIRTINDEETKVHG